MEIRFNTYNYSAPMSNAKYSPKYANSSFGHIYKPTREALDKTFGQETFVDSVLKFCKRLDNDGYGKRYTVKFDCWRQTPKPEIKDRILVYYLSKVGDDKSVTGALYPADILSTNEETWLEKSVNSFKDRIKLLQGFYPFAESTYVEDSIFSHNYDWREDTNHITHGREVEPPDEFFEALHKHFQTHEFYGIFDDNIDEMY